MPTAIVSPPPAAPVNLSTGADPAAALGPASIADTGDVGFAALLIGQMAAELTQLVQTSVRPGGDADGAEKHVAEGEAATSIQITDPSLILTSIGLPPLSASPRLPAGNNAGTDPTAALARLGDARRPAMDSALLWPAATGSEMPADTGTPVLAKSLAGATDIEAAAQPLPATPLQSSINEAVSPAKLAGFAQKLADVQQPGAIQAGPEAPTGMGATPPVHMANLHRSTESAHIETPLRQESWPAEFGQKVVWLATNDKQIAQITLNPPDLGPIEITLNLKNDQANAVFASPHAEVREAIETAIPRLREMFAGVGIDLGQANVNGESFRQAQEGQRERNAGTGGERNGNDERLAGSVEISRQQTVRRGNGLVDTFA